MVFLSRLNLMLCEFVYNTLSADGHENLNFDPFLFEGRVDWRCRIFDWIIILMVVQVF